MKLGYRAIVVTGQACRSGIDALRPRGESENEVRIVPADERKESLELCADRRAREDLLQEPTSFVSIGPAGEMGLRGASVACTDSAKDRHPARHAGRGGLGAVMGSKGLKYVAIDPAGQAGRTQAR